MAGIAELRRMIDTAGGRERIAKIYGKPAEALGPETARLKKILEGFERVFPGNQSGEAVLCTAAGRTEVGGNHTDHQRGRVLAASVSLDAAALAAPNGGTTARLYSAGYGMVEVATDALEVVPAEMNSTKSLVRGILARAEQLGYPLTGFDAYIQSNVPGGSGLSSSACYEVLVGVIVNRLFCRQELTLTEIAQMGQYAENVYFGKPSGLMDQMACALGGIVSIDFKDKEHPLTHRIDFDFGSAGHALCIIDTGADHADLTGDYGAVPAEMGQVAAILGREVLSEVDPRDFYDAMPYLRRKVGDRAVLRAVHYFDDVARVDREAEALERGDFPEFLRLVTESGISSFTYLQNVATYRDPREQPVAVALARAQHLLAGRGAYRVHGGGFAGTIQAFVPEDLLEEFCIGMDALLGKGACQVMTIRPAGGAVLLD